MKTITKLFLIIGIASLASCASPAAMRAKAPSAEYTSSKTAKDVAICIADKWESSAIFGTSQDVNMRPSLSGYTLSLRNPAWGHTALMVDIGESPEGSRTLYYTNMVLGEGSFTDAVSTCQ